MYNNDLKNIEQTKKINDTFLSIIGKSKDEVLITKLVAYILNPKNTTPKIIEKMLMKTESNQDSADFVKIFNNENNNFWDIKTECDIDINGTVDIIIKYTKFWIIIENKIDAQETGNQSLRYEELEKKQDIPIKYIHLKPNYNCHKLQNERFVVFYYKQLLEILKEIKFNDLEKQESFFYMNDLMNHIENFLIGEFSNNWDKVKHENKYKISNGISDKLVEALKHVFGITNSWNNNYTVHFYEKFNCFQIWKNDWNSADEISSRKGIHYEIVFKNLNLYELNYLSAKSVEVSFVIHNESKKGHKIPFENLKRETYLYDEEYDLDSKENIEKSVNKIAEKMKELSEQNDGKIDEIVSNVKRV